MPQYQGSKTVTKYESVKLLKKENYLLVQTDKGQYKAKDTVKFRILALDHDLRFYFLKLASTVAKIFISCPNSLLFRPSEIKSMDEVWIEVVQR